MLPRFATAGTPMADPTASEYRPGVCNIGPDEIARRRRAGLVGVAATAIVFAVLVAVNAPPLVRMLVALPAAGAAVGYLQAWLKFCAGFGSAGVFNFGRVGTTRRVDDAEARRRDRIRSTEIFLGALAIGLAVGLGAVFLPI